MVYWGLHCQITGKSGLGCSMDPVVVCLLDRVLVNYYVCWGYIFGKHVVKTSKSSSCNPNKTRLTCLCALAVHLILRRHFISLEAKFATFGLQRNTFPSGQTPEVSVLPGLDGMVLTCPSKPNKQKVWMFQNAYKLLQTSSTEHQLNEVR